MKEEKEDTNNEKQKTLTANRNSKQTQHKRVKTISNPDRWRTALQQTEQEVWGPGAEITMIQTEPAPGALENPSFT